MFLIIFFPGYNKPYSYQVEDFVCSAICTMQYNYYLHFLFLRKINHSYSAGRLCAEPFARPTAAGRWRGRDRSLSPRTQKLGRSSPRQGEIAAFFFPLCTPAAETVHLQLPAAPSPLFSVQALGTAPAFISGVPLCWVGRGGPARRWVGNEVTVLVGEHWTASRLFWISPSK